MNDEKYIGGLSSQIYLKIQDDILNGVLKDGEPLIENKISKEFGVSRTPVREAIRQLELEGLVEVKLNKGAVIRGVTRKDIEDIFLIRLRIDGLSARLAAINITDDEINELKETLDLEEFFTIKKEGEKLAKFDFRFHETLLRAGKSKPLMYVLKMFHNYVKRTKADAFMDEKRAEQILFEHREILNAVINRDEDLAEEVAKIHVKNAQEFMLNKFFMIE